eukprot:SAG31_NODE_870_length_11338_cov_14.525047_5_plen_164_part_00
MEDSLISLKNLTRSLLRLQPVGDIPIRHGDYTSVFNSAELRRTECPSFNGHGTASALGKIAAALGNGGSLGNVTLLSAAGLAAAAADPVLDQLMPGTRVYTKVSNAMMRLLEFFVLFINGALIIGFASVCPLCDSSPTAVGTCLMTTSADGGCQLAMVSSAGW